MAKVDGQFRVNCGHSDIADSSLMRNRANFQKRKSTHNGYAMCHGGGWAMESLSVFLGGVGLFLIGVAALGWISKNLERLARIHLRATAEPPWVGNRCWRTATHPSAL